MNINFKSIKSIHTYAIKSKKKQKNYYLFTSFERKIQSKTVTQKRTIQFVQVSILTCSNVIPVEKKVEILICWIIDTDS